MVKVCVVGNCVLLVIVEGQLENDIEEFVAVGLEKIFVRNVFVDLKQHFNQLCQPFVFSIIHWRIA